MRAWQWEVKPRSALETFPREPSLPLAAVGKLGPAGSLSRGLSMDALKQVAGRLLFVWTFPLGDENSRAADLLTFMVHGSFWHKFLFLLCVCSCVCKVPLACA